MDKNRVLIFLVLISLVSFIIPTINAKLCADEMCKSIVSTGVTTVRSLARAKGHISFQPNRPCNILARDVGPKKDLLLVEIQGQVGLVSARHIMEKKIYVKTSDLLDIPDVEIQPSIKDIEPTQTESESLPEVKPTQNIVTDGGVSPSEETPKPKATPVVSSGQVIDGTQLPAEEESAESDKESTESDKESTESDKESTESDKESTARHLLFEDDEDSDYDFPEYEKEEIETKSSDDEKKVEEIEKQLELGSLPIIEGTQIPPLFEHVDPSPTPPTPTPPTYDHHEPLPIIEETITATPETHYDPYAHIHSHKTLEGKDDIHGNGTHDHQVLENKEIVHNHSDHHQTLEGKVEVPESESANTSAKVTENQTPETKEENLEINSGNSSEEVTENEVPVNKDEIHENNTLHHVHDSQNSSEEIHNLHDHEHTSAEDHSHSSETLDHPSNHTSETSDPHTSEGTHENVSLPIQATEEVLEKAETTEQPITESASSEGNEGIPNEEKKDEVEESKEEQETKVQVTEDQVPEVNKEEVKKEEEKLSTTDEKIVEENKKEEDPNAQPPNNTQVPEEEQKILDPYSQPSTEEKPLDPYAQPSTEEKPFDPYAQLPKTEEKPLDPYAQPSIEEKPLDPYAQLPKTEEKPLDPYAQLPKTEEKPLDPYAQPPTEQKPLDPYAQPEEKPFDPYAQVETKPSDPYVQPLTSEDKPSVPEQETSKEDHDHHGHEHEHTTQVPEKPLNHETPTGSFHMLPPLMRRHGNQRQVEVKQEEPASEPGFFENLLSSVSSLWSSSTKSSEETEPSSSEETDIFSAPPPPEEFCEKLGPNECPKTKVAHSSFTCSFPQDFLASASHKVLENINLLAVTAIAGFIILILIMSYNCMSNCQRESDLIAKLNKTERDLLASMKELEIARTDLTGTQSKLTSIEDNSFGSNDMVIALKKEIENVQLENSQLHEQIDSLEKELDTATEAGLELNKIIAELLSAQNGDENIVSSVEELQMQLNEQQNTILDINSILAQKSRENSELQILLAETNAKFVGEVESLKQDNEELENERNLIQSKLEEIKQGFEHDISAALESKNGEIRLLQSEIMQWKPRYDEAYKNWQTCQAKIEALQESLKQVKLEGAGGKPAEVYNMVNLNADLSAVRKEKDILKERLENELDSKKSLKDQLKSLTEEIEKVKQDFHQTEKDKLEAQTRLEVLSNYFKDKETQLQKELSVKEAMWLKQQGETTTTVERVKNMQEEIQSLKSQNDALRAEIEAQSAAHKAQIGTLENRAHETWLSARQSERKYEEARLEGANLRRKLTQLSQNGLPQTTTDGVAQNSSGNSAPSPIHMETPGSPIMQMPPPPPFLPPPSFMGLPPPPPLMVPGGGPAPFPPMFLPPGEMRPPPLGRLMSPPPPHHSRYIDDETSILDDDYDDEYDDYDEDRRPRVYPRNGRYSPDSRYDYTSRYDTETDYSPPPSPGSRPRSEDGIRGNGYRDHRDRDRRSGGSQRSGGNNGLNDSSGRSKAKGLLSSGSEKSYSSRRSKGHNV